jgi:uncharacterized protein
MNFSDLPIENTVSKKKSIWGILVLLTLLAGSLVLSKIGVFKLADGNEGIRISLYISRAYYWLLLFVMIVFALKIEKQSFLLWPDKEMHPGYMILSVFGIFMATIISLVVVGIIMLLIGFKPNNEVMKMLHVILKEDHLLLWLICITAGFTEELLFRGYLLPRLSTLFNNKPVIAILVSSALFALLHIGYNSAFQISGPFIIGLVFGFYYWLFRNIKVLIFFHILWDVMAIYLSMHFVK